MSDIKNIIPEILNKYSVTFFDNMVWLSSEEAAVYIRKSVGALRTMVSRGQIKYIKWKRRLYFRKNDLDDLLGETATFIS